MVGLTRPSPTAERASRLGSLRFRRTSPPFPAVQQVVTIAFVAVAMVLLTLVMGLGIYAAGHRDQIYNGVTVAGIPVGGLTRGEASARVQSAADAYAREPVMLLAEGDQFSIVPADVGFDVDIAATVDLAFAVGREDSVWRQSQIWVRALFGGRDVAPVVSVNRGLLEERLVGIAHEVMRPAEDAWVDMGGVGGPVVVPERAGVAFDVTGSRARVVGRFGELSSAPVSLVTMSAAPRIATTDLEASVDSAADVVGRPFQLATTEGSWTVRAEDLKRIVRVDPASGVLLVDESALRRLMFGISSQIDRGSSDAQIVIDGATLTVVSSIDSAYVDIEASTKAAAVAITNGERSAPLVMLRAAPAITTADAERGIAEVEAFLGDGLELTWPEGGAKLGRADLLQALTITPGAGDPFLFGFDSAVLAALIEPLAKELDDPGRNARFRLVDGAITLVDRAKDGELVDRNATLTAVTTSLFAGEGNPDPVELVIVPDRAKVRDSDRTRITLPDVLAEASTGYAGSSEPRARNVERASELEDGWLVPPNGIFSFVRNVGDVDGENGFATGFGIVADEEVGGVTTAPVMGGGICQVSTTIFQAAWWGGFPIVERYQHPYWLTGYGHPPSGRLGLDAMVYLGEDWTLDLKFRNTTDHWIAVEVIADGDSVTTRILGTNPNWTVRVDEPKMSNIVPADNEVIYTDSPELAAGEELRVETAHQGFDVSVKRVVTDQSGAVVLEDEVSSSFAPSRNLILRGTGGA